MKNKNLWFNKKNFCLFILLLLFWLILSLKFTIEAFLSGAIVSILIVIYSQNIAFEEEEMPLYSLKNLKTFIGFIGHLLIEIVKANIEVALIVLNPKMPIQPKFIKIPMRFKKDVNKVIFGNCVTLTPGTLTVDITQDEFIIHALTNSGAEGMNNSLIEEYVMKLEGDKR